MSEQGTIPDPEPPSPSNWQLIKRLLGLAWVYRRGCVLMVGYHLVLVAFMISGLGLLGVGIDYIRYGRARWLGYALPETAVGERMPAIFMIALGVILLASARAWLRYRAIMASSHLTEKIVVALRSQVYEKLQRLSFRFYDANESGSIINRVTGDVQAVRMFVNNVVVNAVVVITTLAVFLIYMLNIHVTLTLACLATLPIMFGIAVVYARIVRPMYWAAREKIDHTVRTLAENVQGVHVVKCFNQHEVETDKFGKANASVRDQRLEIFKRVSLFVPTINFLSQLNRVVLLLFGGYLVMAHDQALSDGIVGVGISLGNLLVFASLLGQFANEVNMVANITNSVQVALTGAGRVFEVIDSPIEIQSKPDALPIPKAKGAVEFRNVSFGYDGHPSVLEDVSFRVEPGQCVAILGATGSGKSTLLSLIPRFYDPIQGQVLIDGVDARDLDLDDLRRNIGLVFQENFLFSTSVKENIAFGHPDASDEQVENAAKIAAAHEFISELEEGYQEELGENALDLSGGQRQRLAIARAVLLEPSILLLDDATSAIDPETEHEILTAMNNAIKGRTTFVVAHRLSTLRRSDLVVVLDKGRVVQIGTHDELMSTKGQYRRAARLQVADDESKRLLGVGEVA